MHSRQIIRDAIVDALTTSGLFDSGSVYTHRFTEIPPVQTAACSIYTTSEEVERSTVGDVYQRTLTVEIDLFTKDMGEDFQDSLDTLGANVESLMVDTLDDLTLQDHFLRNMDLDVVSSGGGYAGCLSLEYTVVYRTTADDPETLLD